VPPEKLFCGGSSEEQREVEGLAVAQDEVAGFGEFVGQGLDNEDAEVARTGEFALEPGVDLGAEADGEVGGLDKGPGEVAVAAFGVAVVLLFAVAGVFGGDGAGKKQSKTAAIP